MASLIYDSFMDDLANNRINLVTDTFKVMLVTSSYVASKAAHDRRNDVTNEVGTSGTGYTTGGVTTTQSCSLDTSFHRYDVTFGTVSWPSSTITARAAVIYKSAGGASSADPLVAYVDFGQDVSSTNATFAITFSSPLRLQN